MNRLAVLLTLLTCGASAGEESLKLPAEVRGQPLQPIVIVAETAGKVVRYRTFDSGLFVIDSSLLASQKNALAFGALPGRYTVWAWTAIDGVPTDLVPVTVVIAGPTPPVPPAPPVPPLPDPVVPDRLATDLAAAFAASIGTPEDKRKALDLLVLLYRQCATLVADPAKAKTAGELLTILRTASQSLAADSLRPVRVVVAAELAKVLPGDTDAVLTDKHRADAAGVFAAVVIRLGGIK